VQVSYHDLDLRTSGGARELKARIRDAAAGVCEELKFRFPVAMVDNPPCFKTAVGAAMARADNAIRDARRYSDAAYYENEE
jgi:UrcA family protein